VPESLELPNTNAEVKRLPTYCHPCILGMEIPLFLHHYASFEGIGKFQYRFFLHVILICEILKFVNLCKK
jgi:hypothetical protein